MDTLAGVPGFLDLPRSGDIWTGNNFDPDLIDETLAPGYVNLAFPFPRRRLVKLCTRAFRSWVYQIPRRPLRN